MSGDRAQAHAAPGAWPTSEDDSRAHIKLNKILLLTFNYTAKLSGGVGAHVQELAHGLKRSGCQVIVLTHSTGETAIVDDGGVQVHYVGASRRTLSQTAQLSIAQNMLAFNQDLIDYAQPLLAHDPQKPDLVHYHHWFTFAAARQIGAAFNLPILGTLHYLTHPIEQWWGETPNPSVAQQENIWLQNAQQLITVSESMRQLVETFYPTTIGKLHVIRNSINLDVFWKTQLSAQARSQLRATIAKSGERIVLFAGRINPMKGLEPLIDSAALVREQYPNVRYVIIGAPDSRDYLSKVQAQVRRSPGLEASVTFLGRLDRRQLALLYQVADVAVFPSIYEPLGMVAVEAMLSGVPPIVSDVGGLAEVVLAERTGLHVPVHTDASELHRVDVPALAAAQLRLLRDESLRQALGQAAFDYVRNELSFERTTLRPTMAVYRQVIHNHQVRAEHPPMVEAQP
ncbi:MAG TPA: glycosyltransferase family 4 protein [Herpetosiphonaceae bacterium]